MPGMNNANMLQDNMQPPHIFVVFFMIKRLLKNHFLKKKEYNFGNYKVIANVVTVDEFDDVLSSI